MLSFFRAWNFKLRNCFSLYITIFEGVINRYRDLSCNERVRAEEGVWEVEEEEKAPSGAFPSRVFLFLVLVEAFARNKVKTGYL